ncbi:hypothetical protein H6O08_001374 [Salmonella enterica]|nr:hypothetical protein [Salmonella enterica]EGS4300354.1 hypothetical protein [Salmonella enterica]EIT1624845.1 hypothetical protein [Salmonella enterica]
MSHPLVATPEQNVPASLVAPLPSSNIDVVTNPDIQDSENSGGAADCTEPAPSILPVVLFTSVPLITVAYSFEATE